MKTLKDDIAAWDLGRAVAQSDPRVARRRAEVLGEQTAPLDEDVDVAAVRLHELERFAQIDVGSRPL